MAIMRARMAFRPHALARESTTGWTPQNLGTLNKAWWRAADLANGAVASWPSLTGTPTPVQATGTAQPIKAATSFNSAYPGVTFDGTDDFLRVVSVGSSNGGIPIGTNEGWIFVLLSVGASGAVRNVFGIGSASANAGRLLQITSTGKLVVTNSTVALTDTGASVSGPVMLCGRWLAGGTSEEGYINTVATNPASAATASNTTAATCIGASLAGTSGFSNGVITEIICTGALSAAQKAQVEGYLAWTYGLTSLLPAGHTYKSARP